MAYSKNGPLYNRDSGRMVDASDSTSYSASDGISDYGRALKDNFSATNPQAATPTATLSDASSSYVGYHALHDLASELVAASGTYPASRTVSCLLDNEANAIITRLTALLGISRATLASRLLMAALKDLDVVVSPI